MLQYRVTYLVKGSRMTTYSSDGTPADTETPDNDDLIHVGDVKVTNSAEGGVLIPAGVADEAKAIVVEQGRGHAWLHDYLEFAGDRLEIRLPTEQALTAFSISMSRYMPASLQNDMVAMFISRHLSEDSYTNVLTRMMDPDDTTYTMNTVGELMSAMSRAAVAHHKELKAAKDDTED